MRTRCAAWRGTAQHSATALQPSRQASACTTQGGIPTAWLPCPHPAPAALWPTLLPPPLLLAQVGALFYETSAKTDANVDNLFLSAAGSSGVAAATVAAGVTLLQPELPSISVATGAC